MDKLKNTTNNQNPSKATVIICAIFLGIFGIHDFLIGKNKEGMMHLLVLSIPIVMFLLISFFATGLLPLTGMLLYEAIIIASWSWGIVEALTYNRTKKEAVYYFDKSNAQSIGNNNKGSILSKETVLSQQKLNKKTETITTLASSINIVTIILGFFSVLMAININEIGWGIIFGIIFILFPALIMLFPSVIFSIYAFILENSIKKNNPGNKPVGNFSLVRTTFTIIVLEVLVFFIVLVNVK